MFICQYQKKKYFFRIIAIGFLVIAAVFCFSGCKENKKADVLQQNESKENLLADKFEGVWVSDSCKYYDYKTLKTGMFPISELPHDIFMDRHIGVVMIKKLDDTYDVEMKIYTFAGISRYKNDFVGQVHDRQNNPLFVFANADRHAKATGDTLLVKSSSLSHLTLTVKAGNSTQDIKKDGYARLLFSYDNTTGELHLTKYYFETTDGKEINNKIEYTNFKRFDESGFQSFCDGVWNKSIEIARNAK